MGLVWREATGWEQCVAVLAERLQKELGQGKRVLWLVPGGSNIRAVVAVLSALPAEQTRQLTIMLTDERFGPVGHAESNLRQLEQAGWNPGATTVIPVLAGGMDADAATTAYAQNFTQARSQADVAIGQFGIGTDGHIAGILPGSPAAVSAELAITYEAPPYVRTTLTFNALRQLDAAYCFVFGADKRAALTRLHDQTLAADEQPAQIVKELPEAYIFTDQVKEGST